MIVASPGIELGLGQILQISARSTPARSPVCYGMTGSIESIDFFNTGRDWDCRAVALDNVGAVCLYGANCSVNIDIIFHTASIV